MLGMGLHLLGVGDLLGCVCVAMYVCEYGYGNVEVRATHPAFFNQ